MNYGQIYHKTCLGILISPPELLKMAKSVDLKKKLQFLTKIGAFSAKMWSKTMYHDAYGYGSPVPPPTPYSDQILICAVFQN